MYHLKNMKKNFKQKRFIHNIKIKLYGLFSGHIDKYIYIYIYIYIYNCI